MSPCGGERGSSESLLSLRLQNGVGPVGVWGRRGLQRAGSTASRSASRSGSSVALDVRVCVVRRVAQYRVSRSIAYVACAGRAGAVIACGGVWYGRGAQRPYGTEAGEGDVWPVGGLECAVQRRPGHTNVNSAFCRDTRNEVV